MIENNSLNGMMGICAHTLQPFRATRRLQLGTQAVAAATFIVCTAEIVNALFTYTAVSPFVRRLLGWDVRARIHILEEEEEEEDGY